MRYVELDGRKYPIRDVLKLYKEQKAADRKAKQLTLFELKNDHRPATQTNAAGRFTEPSLF